MEDSAIVTYTGSSLKLFESLKSRLEEGLPNENIEWKRNFSRPSKSVSVRSKFVPLENVKLSNDLKSITTLTGHPMLHTYWTDCTDIDVYKSFVKDEITNWFSTLRNTCGSSFDWMIILVEISDARKSSKLLPRTSVLDKIKSEFSVAGKQPERCVCLIDPSKNDSRASESWQTLLHRLRLQILHAYNKLLGRFEENMREQREKRNSQNWNFCDYFVLQEQLAFVYEMLGVFDEALVQYDELDALFSQFVLNSNIIDGPYWLTMFSNEFNNWSGLSLRNDTSTNKNLRLAIVQKSPSLTDVRNYLFSRQSVMLLKMNKPWEVARRCLTFLHNVVQELNILEVPCPAGSIACWIFLSTLEVVQVCELKSKEAFANNSSDNRKSSTAHVQQYCLYTAELWAYCRKKLLELGGLCGLLPKSNPSSDQLHLVVELITGISDDYEQTIEIIGKKGNTIVSGYSNNTDRDLKNKLVNPAEKLKEALSSKAAFQKCYLELSESAISTYKHIGRLRSARMVGLDLANFYLDLGQFQTAATFLVDALKTFRIDSWSSLQLNTLMQVANCYESLDDHEKLIRSCAEIICHHPSKQPLISAIQRNMYFRTMEDALKNIQDQLTIDGKHLLDVKSVRIMLNQSEIQSTYSGSISTTQPNAVEEKIISGSVLTLQLDVDSYFPGTIYASVIKASMAFTELSSIQTHVEDYFDGNKMNKSIQPLSKKQQQGRRHSVQRSQSTRSNASSVTSEISCSPSNQSLPYTNADDCKQDIGDLGISSLERKDGPNDNLLDQGTETDKWVETLKLREIRDYKQDRNLSAVRLVCRNSAFILRRKDSTGSMLSSGSTDSYPDIAKSDFKYVFSTEPVHSEKCDIIDQTVPSNVIALNPGRNRVNLTTVAGAIGEYSLRQLSIIAFEDKLEVLSNLKLENCGLDLNRLSFRVISHPVTVSVRRCRKDSTDKLCEIENTTNQQEPLFSRDSSLVHFSEYLVDEPLWAGIRQIVKLSFYTGSFRFTNETEIIIECSEGLTGCQALTDRDNLYDSTNFDSVFNVKLPLAEPFTTVTVYLNVQADLIEETLRNGQHFEHTLTFPNVWSSVEDNEKCNQTSDANTTLYLSFLSPILCQGKVQTAFTNKIFNVEMFSTSNNLSFELSNHKLSLIETCQSQQTSYSNQQEMQHVKQDSFSLSYGINLTPMQRPDEIMHLKTSSACNYLWGIEESPEYANSCENRISHNPDTLDEVEGIQSPCKTTFQDTIYARYEVDYTILDDTHNKQPGTISPYKFIRMFEIKNFKTMYFLKTRVEPNSGGELCRASTICSFSITIEQVKYNSPAPKDRMSSVMYEVITDQSEWAVCGRSAGVINMETAKKQTVVVEVMALVGGHLPLPKVKLSKYIPADHKVLYKAALDNSSGSVNPKPALSQQDDDSTEGTQSFKTVIKSENNAILSTSSNQPDSTDSGSGSSSTPRMEPFSPGQVFNVSHLDRVHVLPPALPSPALTAAVGPNISTGNPISTLVPTILKSVSRNPSSLSSLQNTDKDARKLIRKPSATNSSLSLSSSPSTTTKQPKSLMTIIKGGHKSSVFSTSTTSPSTKSKSIRHEGLDMTKEEYEQQHASLP